MENEIKKDGVEAELKKDQYFKYGEQYFVKFKYANGKQKEQVYRMIHETLLPVYGANSRRGKLGESIIMPYYVNEDGNFTPFDSGVFGGTSLPKDLLPLFIQRFVDADKMTILIGDKKIHGKFDERQFNELLADMEKQNSKLNEQEENTIQSSKENDEDTEIFDKYSTCVEALKDKCNDENLKENIYLNNETIKHYIVDNLHAYEHSKTGEIVIAQNNLPESQLLNNEVKESQMSFHYNEQRKGYECELTVAGDVGRISYGDNNLKLDFINEGRDYAYLPTSKYYGYEFQKDCEISSKNLKDDMKTLLQNAHDNAETEELKKYYLNALSLEQAVELEGVNHELNQIINSDRSERQFKEYEDGYSHIDQDDLEDEESIPDSEWSSDMDELLDYSVEDEIYGYSKDELECFSPEDLIPILRDLLEANKEKKVELDKLVGIKNILISKIKLAQQEGKELDTKIRDAKSQNRGE